MSDILLEGIKQLGFCSDPDSLSKKMERYIQELILFNSAYNLVNTSIPNEIAINHILDSLSAASCIKQFSDSVLANGAKYVQIADIGSGGGLPGIPLAAAFEQYSFTLVERMDKRCAFLENVVALLGLKNVTVLKSQAEQVTPESFDIVTFRAFRPLDSKMAKTLLSLVKKGGTLAAYKAKITSIKEEMAGIVAIVPEYSVQPLLVPYLTQNSANGQERERNLVVVKKN